MAALLLPLLPEWSEQAACADADPEVWFPEKGGTSRPAKRVCNGDDTRPACPVRDECLDYALDNDERFGVWGGLSERQRRRLRERVGPPEQAEPPAPSCGTDKGYQRHRRRGETCGPCREAHRLAGIGRRAS